MTDKNNSYKEKDPIAVELGKRGGLKRFKQMGKKGMKEISLLGVKARAEKRLQNSLGTN